MTIGLSYNDDLSRVQIAISDRPNGTVVVQRVANPAATEALWARGVVRGGHALPVVAGVATLDDFEFFADIPNFYRVTQIGLEDAVDVFTASGMWNKPPGLTAARVIVIPGGSGGGGSAATGVGQASVGNGGATGPVVISVIDAALLGASEIVTIGPGGAGNLGVTGGTGGTSSFGSHVSAVGPAGGAVIPAANTNDSGLGTAASTTGTGQVVGAGSAGGGGLRYIGLGNGGLRGGYGGSGPFGSGGRGAVGLAAGEAASGFGSGGGGATTTPSSGARAGGAGSGGLILVEHIFVD